MKNKTKKTEKLKMEKSDSIKNQRDMGGLSISKWVILVILGGALPIIFFASGYKGYTDGKSSWKSTATVQANHVLAEQYLLALVDIENKQYEIAKQRLMFVLTHNDFVPAAEALIEISVITNSTATSTPLPPTITPTATLDNRPSEELFQQAQSYFNQQQWQIALETLSGLRQTDPNYQIAQIDGMIYAALRNRGVNKILKYGELENGIYDLTLAEQFGPIDIEAKNYQDWARMYLRGNGYWLAYPDIALYYYGLVVNIAPNLIDTSGYSAFYRYWASLIHYGDALYKDKDWCGASQQYSHASTARPDQTLAATAQIALDRCLGPSKTPVPTATQTFTPTVTALFTNTPTITSSPPTASVSETPSPIVTETPTSPLTPINTETPVLTLTPTATSTVTATQTLILSDTLTFTPMPTETPE